MPLTILDVNSLELLVSLPTLNVVSKFLMSSTSGIVTFLLNKAPISLATLYNE